MSSHTRQRATPLERRVRAILAARRMGYRFDERERVLDLVASRILEDLRAMPDDAPSLKLIEPDDEEPLSLEPVVAGRLRLVYADSAPC